MLTQGSAHGDLRPVHPSRTPFELDLKPGRASHSASHNLHPLGSGFVYAGLLACRFFLGLVEGGLFPGIVLYLSGVL
jgi:hypothetical protein